MFNNVIVRKPSKSMINGITTADLGVPDYEKALEQHNSYIEAFKKCGVNVTVLEADENYPDSCFVEDTALLTKKCAIITNPRAKSRKGEEKEIHEALKKFYDNIETIESPGTIEGGDIMMVGNHFYIGLSSRTNEEGARQMIEYLNKYGYSGSTVPVESVLHLKTGVTYIENNTLLAIEEFAKHPVFRSFDIIEVDENESYACNCIWVNDYIIMPKGYEKTKKAIVERGNKVIEVDVSEFRKIDGGLTCLSLRF